MAEKQRNRREVAWRIFAREYNASRELIESQEEMSPSYVLSPLGAKANRVFISGVVTEIENKGSENDPFWTVRITDPTGVFYLSAGQYQADAAKIISKLEVPSYISVLGKTRTYEPEEGTLYTSILPETIVETNQEQRDIWIMDTVWKTKERLNCMSEALAMEDPDEESLVQLGFPGIVVNGVLEAVERYDEIPLEEFKDMLLDPLRTITEEESEPGQVSGEQTTRGISEEENELRKKIIKVIEEIDKDGEGAVYQELMEKLVEMKIDRDEAEDTITKLLDDGLLFEPVLGRLRRV